MLTREFAESVHENLFLPCGEAQHGSFSSSVAGWTGAEEQVGSSSGMTSGACHVLQVYRACEWSAAHVLPHRHHQSVHRQPQPPNLDLSLKECLTAGEYRTLWPGFKVSLCTLHQCHKIVAVECVSVVGLLPWTVWCRIVALDCQCYRIVAALPGEFVQTVSVL